MDILNRLAVVIRPAQPFIDWVHRVDEELGNSSLSEEAIRNHSNVYLIPEFYTSDESEAYLRKRAGRFFEEELAGWYMEPDLWPEERGWETFSQWLKWEIHEMVFDLDDGPLEREFIGEVGYQEFDFEADLKDSSGMIDIDLAGDWVNQLYNHFARSPEADEYRSNHSDEPLGWGVSLFDYIHGYESQTIHEVRPDTFDYALFHHFPRKIMDPALDAQAVIDEFYALFKFLERRYGLENAGACKQYIEERDDLAEDFEEAMGDESVFGMAKSFFSAGASAGFDMGKQSDIDIFTKLLNESGGLDSPRLQQPYKASDADVGRNDPCPCGSGRKYKKCCLRQT